MLYKSCSTTVFPGICNTPTIIFSFSSTLLERDSTSKNIIFSIRSTVSQACRMRRIRPVDRLGPMYPRHILYEVTKCPGIEHRSTACMYNTRHGV